jgi:outer membrane receptor protein involved in Fe transport
VAGPPPSSFRRAAPLLLLLLLAFTAAAADRSALIHTAPTQAKEGEALQIDGTLVGDVGFEKLVVRYRAPGQDYAETRLELQYGDLYRGTIPASRMVAPGVEYYVEGGTRSGERIALFATAGKPARVLIFGPDGKPEEPSPQVKEPKAPKGRTKKGKKGKGDPEPELLPQEREVPAKPEPEPIEPEPAKPDPDKPEPKGNARRTEPEPPPLEKPKATQPEPPPPEKPRATRPPERSPEKKSAEPPRKKSELEEELQLYGAEDTSGLQVRMDSATVKVPQLTTRISAEQIRQSAARTVYDVLDLVPGLTVSRDVQGFYRIAFRGLRADPEVLVLLDGMKLNSFDDGKVLLNLPVSNIESIEVTRGPGSATHGLGAFLGSIAITTRREDGLRVSGGGGSWDTAEGHLSAGITLGRLRLFLDGDYLQTRGFKKDILKDGLDSATASQGFRLLTDPAGQTQDRRRLVNAGLAVALDAGGAGTFGLQGRFMLENRGALVGQYDAYGRDSQLDWLVGQGALTWEKPLGEASALSARLWFDQQSTNRLYQLTPDGFQVASGNPATRFEQGVQEQQQVSARSLGAEVGGQFALPFENRLWAGASFELQSLPAYAYLINYVPVTNLATDGLLKPAALLYPQEQGSAASRINVGLSLQDQWTPLQRLSIQVGVRLELVSLPSVDAAGKLGGSSLAVRLNPRVGLVFAPTNALVLKLNYGRAFRPPTVSELSLQIPNSDFDQGRFIGNPSLRPADIDTVELGAELVQTLGEGKLLLRGAGFFSNLSNAIASIDTTGNIIPVGNRTAGVRAFGLEGEARYELGRGAAFVNVAWVRAEDLLTPSAARLLTDVPQVRLNMGITVPIGPWLLLDVVARLSAERRNLSRSVLELLRRYKLPAYATVGAQLRTPLLFDHLELSVLGQNVFDVEYADDAARPDRVTAGVPREGVSFFGTIKVVL